MTLTRRLGCMLVAAAVVAALLPFATAPASAKSSRYLCTGYVGCQEAGYSHFGYRKAGKKMWWRMYAGHNCTNYVAYRLVKGGMSAERPWSSTGMAYNWGKANRGKTDRKPMVGAVAWWKRNAPGAGSSGHVAYVEKVVSRRKIIVSEDSWSGDFHWRKVTRSGSGWPTGFIHFDDRRVEVRERPSVTGTAEVGRTLTARAGRWAPAASYRFEWLADGRPIAGATGTTLDLTPQLRGRRIAVRVLAHERGYLDGKATSAPTTKVAKGSLTVVSRPAVTGTARVDEVLRLEPGSWSPAADSVAIRWFADGERIRGARGPRLLVDRKWIGERITVRTIARTEGYRASPVDSEQTGPVRPGEFAVTSPFLLDGRATRGGRLTVTVGDYQPAEGKVSYHWLRNGRTVDGADGRHLDLGVADVGKRMSVRVTLTHPGYRDRTIELATDQRVTTTPELDASATGKPGRAVVRLRVTAPGVEAPGGTATVRVGGHEVAGRVVDGRLRVVVPDLARGTYRVRVAYAGTEVVRPGETKATVKVPRRDRG